MSKRLNLREFQQRVIERLQDKNATAARISTLGVRIAGQNWLVAMADISEVLPVPVLTPVPVAKPWFLGVANVRGNLYGVTDMAAYRHAGPTPPDTNNRVLLVAGRYAFNAALLVERVLGLRDARGWQPDEEPGSFRDEQGALWHSLDIRGLLEQTEFLQIGI
ncbi:MAG: hypothetical protein A2Z95_08690 [Gallionellales bacterium GWA2_60_18]|nr:MAG: hypothetical protein A2Z95_08690 [Gallionellales bacterium GWA2_60_18]